MKRTITLALALMAFTTVLAQGEQPGDYVEFDDRKNIVHGVYLGLNLHYGQINSLNTAFASLKLAYVANRKIEVGLGATGFYNSTNNDRPDLFNGDKIAMIGGYTGLHVEPILFGKRLVSVSFPILVGGGVVGYFGHSFTDELEDLRDEDFDEFFIVEPGINILYNFTRFTQLETGIRYRITSKYNLLPYDQGDINGLSVGVGLKIGIFNMGRKRKKIKDDF